jgi:hypothetical protein
MPELNRELVGSLWSQAFVAVSKSYLTRLQRRPQHVVLHWILISQRVGPPVVTMNDDEEEE